MLRVCITNNIVEKHVQVNRMNEISGNVLLVRENSVRRDPLSSIATTTTRVRISDTTIAHCFRRAMLSILAKGGDAVDTRVQDSRNNLRITHGDSVSGFGGK